MIIIAGTIRVPTENRDAAWTAIGTLVTATRAEAGCEHYAFAEDILDPGLIHVSERWTDRSALAAHAAASHFAAWRAEGAALGVHARDLRLYDVDGFTPI